MKPFLLKTLFFAFLLSISTSYLHAQLAFRENKGQMVDMEGKKLDDILFEIPDQPLGVFIRKTGLSYIFHSPKGDSTYLYRLDMELEGANPNPETESLNALLRVNNYYLSNCPEGITGVREFEKVALKEVYPGIDWILYFSDQGLKYDFRVKPGADPRQIKLKYIGADKFDWDRHSATIHTRFGSIQEGKLAAFQGKSEVPSSFELQDDVLRINLGQYDNSQELLIDPPLFWSTYFGSASSTGNEELYLAESGTLYLSGRSLGTGFPGVNPGNGAWYTTSNAGGSDLYIARLNTNRQITWATLYGGSNYESSAQLYEDKYGKLWACGVTQSTNFPAFNPGGGAFYQGTMGGGTSDGYLVGFDNNGVRKWATYYGGNSYDEIIALAGDSSGRIFMGGRSASPSGLTMADPGGGAYFSGTFYGSGSQAIILEFDSNYVMTWGTHFGGYSGEEIHSIFISPDQDIFLAGLAGYLSIGPLPITNPGGGAFIDSIADGPQDFFILKFNSNRALEWSTYVGGTDNEIGLVTVSGDTLGHIYLSGIATSADMPTLNPGGGAYFQGSRAGVSDMYIAKFSTEGVMEWATYCGGTGTEMVYPFYSTTSKDGKFHFLGDSQTNNFPLVNPGNGSYYQAAPAGGQDLLFGRFDQANGLEWSTFVGGNAIDYAGGIQVDPAGNVLISGLTYSSNFPLVNPANGWYYNPTFSGTSNPFITQFGNAVLCSIQADFGLSSSSICLGDTLLLTNSSSGGTAFSWKLNGNSFSNQSNTSIVLPQAGSQVIELVIVDGACRDSIQKTVTVNSLPAISVAASPSSLCAGDSTLLSASGGGPNYNFQGPGLNVSGVNVVSFAPQNTAWYYASFTDANGCTGLDSTQITVNSLPSIQIMLSAAPLCLGDTLAVSAAGGTGMYDFSGPGFLESGVGSTQAVPNASGWIHVAGTSAQGCAGSDSAFVTVNALPPVPTITQNGPQLTSSASSGNQWFLNGNPISGATNPTFTATQNGTYQVQVTNAQGCSVLSAPLSVVLDGQESLAGEMDLIVFPNPTQAYLMIQGTKFEQKNTSIALFDQNGRQLRNWNFPRGISRAGSRLELGPLPAGLYHLVLRAEAEFSSLMVQIKP
ncbi:MAG: hypothetical protein H6581_12880 [Bacteroidia bacterium]|nr:hypothetical protein [Bacteroidia bacterium]